MPLCDHFRPPPADKRSWDELHGGRPMMLVAALSIARCAALLREQVSLTISVYHRTMLVKVS
jgi:hypothetical protein